MCSKSGVKKAIDYVPIVGKRRPGHGRGKRVSVSFVMWLRLLRWVLHPSLHLLGKGHPKLPWHSSNNLGQESKCQNRRQGYNKRRIQTCHRKWRISCCNRKVTKLGDPTMPSPSPRINPKKNWREDIMCSIKVFYALSETVLINWSTNQDILSIPYTPLWHPKEDNGRGVPRGCSTKLSIRYKHSVAMERVDDHEPHPDDGCSFDDLSWFCLVERYGVKFGP